MKVLHYLKKKVTKVIILITMEATQNKLRLQWKELGLNIRSPLNTQIGVQLGVQGSKQDGILISFFETVGIRYPNTVILSIDDLRTSHVSSSMKNFSVILVTFIRNFLFHPNCVTVSSPFLNSPELCDNGNSLIFPFPFFQL